MFNEQNNSCVCVRYNSLYISSPSSAKQQREMTKFWVFWRTRAAAAAYFSYFHLALHIKLEQETMRWLEQVLRTIDAMNRSRHLREFDGKVKIHFFLGVALGVAVVIA